ncbi:MAG: hypothetical protein CVU38_00840 [Chloroflexi bacterium HGW-Chloroflexi-1]|nr:MAG: hypothetical protein CVU38_00840 [Chloroflexi bacterium HGW-Chloroflexi-1]
MRDGRRKLWIIVGSMAAVGLGSAAFGYVTAGTRWVWGPVAALAVVALGEVRRLVIRKRHRGAPPVVTENARGWLRAPVTTTDLVVARYELVCPDWPGPDFRIAHVSDFHVNSHLPPDYYRAVMARVAASHPDFIFHTGDFVTKAEYAPLLPDILSAAKGRLGTFAILGNHDYWAGAAQVAAAVRASAITLLDEHPLRVAVGPGAALRIFGYEYPWRGRRWQPPHLAAGEIGLVLTHTPDNIYALRDSGMAAVFAGHYHAGQIKLPLLGPVIVPSSYGRRFDHGHFVFGAPGQHTHLFVTAGVGAAMPRFRILCQPDIFVVDVRGREIQKPGFSEKPGWGALARRHHSSPSEPGHPPKPSGFTECSCAAAAITEKMKSALLAV